MTTHEHEIVGSIKLANTSGKLLNSDAKGWSRFPFHEANLRGKWGRNKRWDYWAILAGDLVISGVYANVDYLGMADVWWCDLTTSVNGGRALALPGGGGLKLPSISGQSPLSVQRKNFQLEMHDDALGNTTITATWVERNGVSASLDAEMTLPVNHESLNVVIPWSDKRFQFTTKHQARPSQGTLRIGEVTREFGDGNAWGVVDIGRGRWPYRTNWNWGGGAGVTAQGDTIGIQIGGKWTAGTGFTENGILVNGRLHKIGNELNWQYDWAQPLKRWKVRDPGGQLDIELVPTYDKHSKTSLGVLRMETHQVFGQWNGRFVDDDGQVHAIEGFQGFAEESRSRW